MEAVGSVGSPSGLCHSKTVNHRSHPLSSALLCILQKKKAKAFTLTSEKRDKGSCSGSKSGIGITCNIVSISDLFFVNEMVREAISANKNWLQKESVTTKYGGE